VTAHIGKHVKPAAAVRATKAATIGLLCFVCGFLLAGLCQAGSWGPLR